MLSGMKERASSYYSEDNHCDATLPALLIACDSCDLGRGQQPSGGFLELAIAEWNNLEQFLHKPLLPER